jgi:Carbohydrate family 9 binding domain-like
VGTGGQYVITANNAYREAEAGNPGYGEDAAWFARTFVRGDGTGYDAEFRISLAAIGNPNPGDIIGFTVAVNDDDDGAGGERQVIWIGLPHTEATYGNLIIGQRSYTAPKTPAPPTIDGVINPDEYPGAEEIRINGFTGNYELDGLADGFPPEDLNYRAWVIHDAEAVYVAVDVVDDQVATDSAAAGTEDGNTWEDDSVEIFFDPNNSKNLGRSTAVGAGQYVYTAAGAWRDNEANNPAFGPAADWFAQTALTPSGYQIEFKVTKSVLQAPADGGTMGFNIAVNDDDGANRKAQLNWNGRPHHEYTYGQLVLGGQGFLIKRIEITGNNVKLTFISPNPAGTHAVQSKAALTEAQWSPVTGVSFAPGVGADLTATFPKPAGTTQFYRLSVQ